MTSTIPIPIWLLIGTKVTNLSIGLDGKTYLKVLHNWSMCVKTEVKSTDLEIYGQSCTSFTIIFITLFGIMLISSLKILCDNYDLLSCPLFPYFSIWVAKNGSYLLRSPSIPKKFALWNEPIISSCPRKTRPRVLRRTTALITRWITSRQYSFSSSVECANWRLIIKEVLLRTTVSTKASRCDCDLLCLSIFSPVSSSCWIL